jgi:predicted GH43/DUF377 family glycosyl hydrolase
MIRRISEARLFRPEELKPLRDDDTMIGVFNPGAAKVQNEVVILVRVAEKPLAIYHGSRRTDSAAGKVGAYSAGAVVLHRDDPTRILRRPHEPSMRPTSRFKRDGFVTNVVFATAMIDRGETLQVYYGASDTVVGVVEFSVAERLAARH